MRVQIDMGRIDKVASYPTDGGSDVCTLLETETVDYLPDETFMSRTKRLMAKCRAMAARGGGGGGQQEGAPLPLRSGRWVESGATVAKSTPLVRSQDARYGSF